MLGLGMSNCPMLQPEEGPDPELWVPCPPWLQPHSRLPAPAGWQCAQHLLLPPRGVPAAAAVQRALPHPGACRQCSPDVAAAICVFPGPAATGGAAGRCPEPGRRFHGQSCLHPSRLFLALLCFLLPSHGHPWQSSGMLPPEGKMFALERNALSQSSTHGGFSPLIPFSQEQSRVDHPAHDTTQDHMVLGASKG